MRVIAEGRRRQPLTSDPQLTSEQGGSRKLGGEVSSTDSLSKNTESVQMVSEGGKLVPRIIPSVRQIEKTKPKRLNDPVSKPSEDSLSSEGNSADKSGGRRGRSGGVGWRKDLDESEQKEYESHPPGVRKDKYPPHVSTNDVIFKETRNSAGNSSDGLGSIVEEDTTLAEERLKYVSSGKFNADSAIGTSGKLVAVPKKASPDEPTAAASRTFVQPRAPVNYGELRKEIEDLKAEMNELKAAKRSRADSVDNARLQPLSSQPLNARGLVSPTFQNNVSNDARKQRKYLTENSDLENKPVYNVSSQIRDAKLSSSGSFASSLQGDGVVQSNTKESLTGNPPGNNSKTAMVRDTKYSFSSIATKQNAGTHEFANRALNPALGENVSNEKKNNETKPISRLESKPNLGGNPQRFDQSLNRSKRWPTNSPTTPLHVAARRRKAISQRRANANRNPNASDKAIEVAWKKNKRKQGDGCARRALRRMMTARSSSFILLPFHFILAAFFVLYLMVGTLIIVMGSEGRVGAWHWAAVSGNAPLTGDQPLSVHDPPGRALVRQEVLEKVMDMAVEAVLVRSKREVLKNIFNSPDMQAAFRAHQYSITQYSITQYSITQDSITQDSITQYSITQYSITQDSITQYSITQDSITQDSIIQYRIIQYRIIQYRIIQYRIIQYRIIQYRIIQYSIT
ncbi:hypothetical protein FHG87_022508 [Trinorchestia longiramus]|nr:hypothetical protein FHG87_022508 [Trinorchestia longiramus]